MPLPVNSRIQQLCPNAKQEKARIEGHWSFINFLRLNGGNILKSLSENQLFSGFNLLLCPNGNWKEVKERQ
jgi:hypothetical protein